MRFKLYRKIRGRCIYKESAFCRETVHIVLRPDQKTLEKLFYPARMSALNTAARCE